MQLKLLYDIADQWGELILPSGLVGISEYATKHHGVKIHYKKKQKQKAEVNLIKR